MRFVDHLIQRTPYERTFHAVLYEVVGVITSAPIIALFTGKNLTESSTIAIIVSVIATCWNYVYNYGYDKLRHRYNFDKTALIRVLHGIGFEVGLIMITVPVIALTMGLTFLGAFKLELAMLIYFFPYTILFNWGYDKTKAYAIQHLN